MMTLAELTGEIQAREQAALYYEAAECPQYTIETEQRDANRKRLAQLIAEREARIANIDAGA